MSNDKMTEQMTNADGFIAALDQSGGSTPKALRLYGIEENTYSGDEEMFAKIHEMRARIIKSPAFTGQKVIGAILFERTMDGDIDGTPTATYLWQQRGVVPFLKVDKGLADEVNGVQLMKASLTLCWRARSRKAYLAPRCARSSMLPMSKASRPTSPSSSKWANRFWPTA